MLLQSLLHPSPLTVLPSSHASSNAWTPSPQVDAHALGSAVPQSKPHSTVHVDEQPSSLSKFWSSHVSLPPLIPSPHTVGAGVVLVVVRDGVAVVLLDDAIEQLAPCHP